MKLLITLLCFSFTYSLYAIDKITTTPVDIQQVEISEGKKGLYFKYTDEQNLYATHSGEVAYVGFFKKYGNVLLLRSDYNMYIVYLLKNAKFFLSKGDSVSEGQVIGISSNARLYYVIRINKKSVKLKYDFIENSTSWKKSGVIKK